MLTAPVVYRMIAVTTLAISSCTAEAGSEGEMVIHFCREVGVCLVVWIHWSYGTRKWRMPTGREYSLLPSATSLVISGMLLHGAPEFALSVHACPVCGSSHRAPQWMWLELSIER